jgi:hypothetical protein
VNLGDDIEVTAKVEYIGDIVNPSGYPHAVNSPTGGSLQINRRRGNANSSAVVVTVTFKHPVIPSFSLSDIDGWNGALEKVKITGKCNDADYFPQLSYAHKDGKNGSWYEIISTNEARATKKSNITEKNPAGRLNVAFSGGITEIKIEYTIETKINSSVTNHLFISPITIKQVPPPPTINEDGLSFTKDVKQSSITTCENPEYSFEITNTNCDPKYVIFSDTLPAGLKWNIDLLMLDAVNQENTSVKIDTFDYSGRHVLQITDLKVLGSTRTSFTIPAILLPGAVTQSEGSKTFNNHANIEYILFSGQIGNTQETKHTLFSEDRYNPGRKETSFTATWQQQYDTIEVTYSHSPLKYLDESEVEFEIKAVNKNAPVTSMFLDIQWQYGDYYKFAYVKNSFTAESDQPITIVLATDITPQEPPPSGNAGDTIPWLLIAGNTAGDAGFTLPTGTTVFKFKLKAPNAAGLVPTPSESEYTGMYEPLIVDYSFSTDSDDPCVQKSMMELTGEIVVLYDDPCITPVITTNIVNKDTTICYESNLLIIDSIYIENCIFGNEIDYAWEFRAKGSSTWTLLESDVETITDCSSANKLDKTLERMLTITSATTANEGYYRLTVSSPINNGATCTASDSVYVRVQKTNVVPDIRVDICLEPARQIYLTSFLDSIDYTCVAWEKGNNASPNLNDSETGEVNIANMRRNATYTYKYTLTSQCGTSSAIAYVHIIGNRPPRKIDTVVICQSQELSKYVQLNQILGLELGGTWEYNSSVNPDNTVELNVKQFPASSKYHGAQVFNAYQAWYTATVTDYNITYKSDTNAKKFIFHYTPASNNICVTQTQKLVIIVTSELTGN